LFLLWCDDEEVKERVAIYTDGGLKVKGIPDTPYGLMEGQA
jgi:hypothetical protein